MTTNCTIRGHRAWLASILPALAIFGVNIIFIYGSMTTGASFYGTITWVLISSSALLFCLLAAINRSAVLIDGAGVTRKILGLSWFIPWEQLQALKVFPTQPGSSGRTAFGLRFTPIDRVVGPLGCILGTSIAFVGQIENIDATMIALTATLKRKGLRVENEFGAELKAANSDCNWWDNSK